MSQCVVEVVAQGQQIGRGKVLRAQPGDLQVRLESQEVVPCDLLQHGCDGALSIKAGDEVLVALPAVPGGRGCVLGLVGSYGAAIPAPTSDDAVHKSVKSIV